MCAAGCSFSDNLLKSDLMGPTWRRGPKVPEATQFPRRKGRVAPITSSHIYVGLGWVVQLCLYKHPITIDIHSECILCKLYTLFIYPCIGTNYIHKQYMLISTQYIPLPLSHTTYYTTHKNCVYYNVVVLCFVGSYVV